MSLFSTKKDGGFTVIELLVVVSIIGLLTSVVSTSFSYAREKSRVSKRVSDLKQVQVALELYYAVNRSYPNTSSTFRSECASWGGYTPSNVIPGLVPNYLPIMPSDPTMDKTNSGSCYIYISNGIDYAFLDHQVADLVSAPYTYATYPDLIDPGRDSGPSGTIVDGTAIWSWKVYSPGGAGF